jgi:hypothetical protein
MIGEIVPLWIFSFWGIKQKLKQIIYKINVQK